MYIVKDISHYCNVSVERCKEIRTQIINYYDLTFVLKGSLTYILNGKTYVLSENDAILLPPGTLRERSSLQERVKYVSFNFSVLPEAHLPTKIFMQNIISREIRTLISAFPQSHLSPLYHSKEKIASILNYILLCILDTSGFESNNPLIIEMIKFIDENLSKPITLPMIAEHVHFSREYVAYVFKKEVGKTVIGYITERKMLMARAMIQSGEISLNDIASSLGYENYSYFSRLFKKHFNISPMQFKHLCNT